jgi:hypothetical protein
VLQPGYLASCYKQRKRGNNEDHKIEHRYGGFSETERVNAAQALGAGAYVKKPYVVEKLGLAVRKELERVA